MAHVGDAQRSASPLPLPDKVWVTLIVTGWTTSVCVESTIRDAFFRDYRCVLVEDCAAEPMGHGLSRSNHEASVLTIQVRFGWISSAASVIRALESPGR